MESNPAILFPSRFPPECEACGYSLIGLPHDGICPECGQPFSEPPHPTRCGECGETLAAPMPQLCPACRHPTAELGEIILFGWRSHSAAVGIRMNPLAFKLSIAAAVIGVTLVIGLPFFAIETDPAAGIASCIPLAIMLLYWLGSRFRRSANRQVRLNPGGFGERRGPGPVNLSSWALVSNATTMRIARGVYYIRIESGWRSTTLYFRANAAQLRYSALKLRLGAGYSSRRCSRWSPSSFRR